MGERTDGPRRAPSPMRRRRVRAQADEMAALLDAAAPRKRRTSGRRAAVVPATAFAVLSLGGVSLVVGFAPTSAGAHLELPDTGAETAPPVVAPAIAPTGSAGTLDEAPAGTPDRDDAPAARRAVPPGAPHRSAPAARPAPGTPRRAESSPTTTRPPRTTSTAPRPRTGRSQPPTTTTTAATPTTQADDGDTAATERSSPDAAAPPEGFAGRGGASGDGTDAASDLGGW